MAREDIEKKKRKVAEIQDDKGCMVEVKENENGDYEIIHYNCPIANIATTYHEICKNEKNMYNDIFPESDVVSTSRITAGDHCCKWRSEEHTSELQSRGHLVCRLLLEKKK